MVDPPLSLQRIAVLVLCFLVRQVDVAYAHPASQLHDANLTTQVHQLAKREDKTTSHGETIAFGILIPILVLASGLFAGLTLGYMSLDETQLHVLSISGSAKQKEYANKIKPIRANGHLLLVTLLLANMIVNETLPVISSPVLGGGVQGVVVSTVLIVIFAEIIPQSICTRHGLYVGAKLAGLTRVLIWVLGIVAWPVAKLLEFALGPHHGIIYRRAELKELIAMHSQISPHGGDLRSDTVTIIGATLDLQDKTVKQAMTPIARCFMLSIDAKLDYDTLRRICLTGHSRVPVYEEVEIDATPAVMNILAESEQAAPKTTHQGLFSGTWGRRLGNQPAPAPLPKKVKVKKIIGILLVKQCVLLDPEDAVPVRQMRINKVMFVPQNESLLGILDRFQMGRSHMAMISRMSIEKAQSVKKAVKKGLTQRLKQTVLGDQSSDESDTSESEGEEEQEGSEKRKSKRGRKVKSAKDLESGESDDSQKQKEKTEKYKPSGPREQNTPADAVLTKEGAEDYILTQGIDPAVLPLGIITLEDVLEELIGTEIYDEFDAEGLEGQHSSAYVPPGAEAPPTKAPNLTRKGSAPELRIDSNAHQDDHDHAPGIITPGGPTGTAAGRKAVFAKPMALQSLKNLGFLRSRSAPPTPREPRRRHSEGTSPRPTPGYGTPGDGDGDQIEVFDESTTALAADVPQVNVTAMDADAHLAALDRIAESPSASPPKSLELHRELASEDKPAAGKHILLDGSKPTSGTATPAPGTNVTIGSTPTPSRSESPAPLEAVLLDRKRRGASTLNVPVAATGIRATGSTASSTKGKGFKSSPLTAEGPDLPFMIAEQNRKERGKERTQAHVAGGKEGEESIPNLKEKTGPDKE